MQNYFKIAPKITAAIKGIFPSNIHKLVLWVTFCILILCIVIDKFSYRSYDKNSNQIVQIVLTENSNKKSIKETIALEPVLNTIIKKFPEVTQAIRLKRIGFPKISYLKKSYQYGTFAYVDPNFFKVFNIPIIKGNKTTPLKKPNTIVLTQKEALKYFGSENPIGKKLILEKSEKSYTVTGIIDKTPNNPHFRFDMLASIEEFTNLSTTSKNFDTYLVLKKAKDYKPLEIKLASFIENLSTYKKEISLRKTFKSTFVKLTFMPLTDIRLDSNFSTTNNSSFLQKQEKKEETKLLIGSIQSKNISYN